MDGSAANTDDHVIRHGSNAKSARDEAFTMVKQRDSVREMMMEEEKDTKSRFPPMSNDSFTLCRLSIYSS